MSDLATAMCQRPGCNHTELVSLGAWIGGEIFEHCGLAMRLHAESPDQVSEAIAAALEDGIEPHLIIARLGRGGVTDVNPESITHRQRADEKLRARPTAPLTGLGSAQKLTDLAKGVVPVEHPDYSVLLTEGPTDADELGLAVTLISHNPEHDAKLVRAVYSNAPNDDAERQQWLLNRLETLVAVLTGD
jgi:hypothetical protein